MLLQTHTSSDFEAAELGSTVPNAMSVRPPICTRPGTVAVIETEPVEVEPSDPCVTARAVPGMTSAQQPSSAPHFEIFDTVHPHLTCINLSTPDELTGEG